MTASAMCRSFLVFLLSLFTLMLSTLPASAQAHAGSYTFKVNTTADTHDAHPGDGTCADAQAKCSLRAAIEEADALPSGSLITITVPAGTYALTLGTLKLTANTISINGADSKTTIIKGNYTFEILSVIDQSTSAQLNRLTIEDGSSNRASGGIYNAFTLSVNYSTITANKDGGIANSGTLTVNHSVISNNSTTSDGGGISNFFGVVTVNYSAISGNSATERGGAIYTQGYHVGSPVNLLDSAISGNSAADGGGILSFAADVKVMDSTISNNSATNGDGGAIDLPASDGGSVTVYNSTISGNSATGKGGNIANTDTNGTFTLAGTIVANSKGAPNCTRRITDQGYNLDSGTSCSFHKKTDLSNTNPMLGPLRNNGGPTQTMALEQGSQAIDWVALASCSAADQRGHKRPDAHEQACDIGAYESAY